MYEPKIQRGVSCVMTMKKDAKFEKELTSSKLAWGIYQILTWALNNLKNLHFNRLLLTKVYNAEELRLMALKINKKIWRKTVVSQMVKIWWILIWALKSLKNLHFDWSFPVMLDLKKYSGVIFHNIRDWSRIWHKTCGLENNMRNLANFHQSTWRSQNWDFDGILLFKVENIWA